MACSLKSNISCCVYDETKQFLKQLEDSGVTDVYQLVISEVERPLLHAVMEHTHRNQSQAAKILGLSRGTLRKKLEQHKLT